MIPVVSGNPFDTDVHRCRLGSRCAESTSISDRRAARLVSMGGLVEALAAPLKIERQRLPCAVLGDLLLSRKLPRCSRRLQDLALLWAAIQNALFLAIRTDWAAEQCVERTKAWNTVVRDRPSLTAAWRFQFAPAPSATSLVLPRATAAFLAALTPELIHAVTRWAPPVVAIGAERGNDGEQPDKTSGLTAVPVLGNVVSAFLANRLDPEGKVWVRELVIPAEPQFSMQELAAASLPLLTPIVAAYRDHIVRAAPTSQLAEVVTGLQRAMVFRLRASLV